MTTDSKDIKVSIIGSYRKSQDELKQLFEYASSNYTLLSPASIEWADANDTFVRTKSEKNEKIADLEDRHLEALCDSDFIFLHAPAGYVGTSATFELGFAKALGIPVLSRYPIYDEILSEFISVNVFDTHDAIDAIVPQFDSGEGLKVLQRYYARTAKRRGWDQETAKETLILLLEELGELARAIRKHENMNRDHEYNVELSDELADVQHYLTHLANQTNTDLAKAITDKELKNEERFRNR